MPSAPKVATISPDGPITRPKDEPRRAGDEALFGFGAHKGGGTVTRVMKATGCDDKTAMSLLAKTGGDWQAAAKLGAA